MIQFVQVSKAFGTQQVISEVTFTVNPGERVGLVGPNGAGKSTLFEMLAGGLPPDKGEVVRPSSLRLGYVRQQLYGLGEGASLLDYVENAIPELNVLHAEMEQLEARLPVVDAEERGRLLNRLGTMQTEFEHQGGYELKTRAEATLSGLGFDVRRFGEPFASFSGGWKIRAELARILVSRPDILLLDEPTNYLDVPAVEWLRDYLKAYSGTLLLVSHDRYLLNSLTTVTLEVMGGRVTRYNGNYAHYVLEREARHEQLLAQQRNIDRRREQLERFVDRFKYKATKAAQAQSRQKMLDRLEEVEVPQVVVKTPKIILPAPPRSGQEVVRIDDGYFSYDGKTDVLQGVDLRLERGEKAAFVGLNGMGKTTLLRLIAGKMSLRRGRLVLGHGVAVGYQSQDYAETMDGGLTVFSTVRQVSGDRSDGELRNLLGGFGFAGDAIDKRVQVLSGGEKVRLALARLLMRPNNFLLLDEPTTHLDIYAREALEEALREYPGTLCLVSHDIAFVRNLATTIFALSDGKLSRYYGNYDYYREKLHEQDLLRQGVTLPPPTLADTRLPLGRRDRKREEAQVRADFSRERRQWEQAVAAAETESEALEKEQAEIYDALSAARPGTDFAALNRRLSALKDDIEAATGRWEAAAAALDDVRKRQEDKLNSIP